MLRRIASLAVLAALISAAVPRPAFALSTQGQIQLGEQANEEILRTHVVETDPLLNAYVASITGRLWRQVARKDIPYNFHILKSTTINAFSTVGGYVYVDEGLIDFVQSDDELAGVLGHETGHIERNHVVTMQTKAQVLNILFGIASIFSPLVYQFGNLAEAGLLAKLSRADELQADRYGLLLMSRAGYDPEAMVTMMERLATLQNEHSSLIDKYLEDHPDPAARVAHLVGYPELDPTKVTTQELLVRALGDLDRARYSTAMYELDALSSRLPDDPQRLLGLGRAEIAMGFPAKAAQAFQLAERYGDPPAQRTASEMLAQVQAMQNALDGALDPDPAPARATVKQARERLIAMAAQIQTRVQSAKDQLRALDARMNAIQNDVPNLGAIQIRDGSRLQAVNRNLEEMARAINSALQDMDSAVGGAGSLEKKHEGGLLGETDDILKKMEAPLALQSVPPESAALLPAYPHLADELARSESDTLEAVDAARVAAMQLDSSLGDLDRFLNDLSYTRITYFGDLSPTDYQRLVPEMQKTLAGLDRAAVRHAPIRAPAALRFGRHLLRRDARRRADAR
jgi:predicted Zn-dependent protease